MTLAIQADVEKFLQIDVTTEPSAPVTMLLENASGLVESYVGRDLELASYVEDYDLPDGSMLVLNNAPIVTPPAVVVTLATSGTVLVEDTDYVVKAKYGQLVRITASRRPARWNAGGGMWINEVNVTYDAGYDFAAAPLLIRDARVARDTTTRIVARAFQAAAAYAALPAGADAIKSITLIGSDSVTYRQELTDVASAAIQLTPEDKTALRGLRRTVLV